MFIFLGTDCNSFDNAEVSLNADILTARFKTPIAPMNHGPITSVPMERDPITSVVDSGFGDDYDTLAVTNNFNLEPDLHLESEYDHTNNTTDYDALTFEFSGNTSDLRVDLQDNYDHMAAVHRNNILATHGANGSHGNHLNRPIVKHLWTRSLNELNTIQDHGFKSKRPHSSDNILDFGLGSHNVQKPQLDSRHSEIYSKRKSVTSSESSASLHQIQTIETCPASVNAPIENVSPNTDINTTEGNRDPTIEHYYENDNYYVNVTEFITQSDAQLALSCETSLNEESKTIACKSQDLEESETIASKSALTMSHAGSKVSNLVNPLTSWSDECLSRRKTSKRKYSMEALQLKRCQLTGVRTHNSEADIDEAMGRKMSRKGCDDRNGFSVSLDRLMQMEHNNSEPEYMNWSADELYINFPLKDFN